LAGITNVQPAAPEISTCPTCGGPLEKTPDGGFGCMSCLLRAGIGSEEEVAQDSTPDGLGGGVRFGVYEIDCHPDGSLYELGRGAMGVTYRATDTSLQRKVALKIIKIDIAERSADARERFVREARAAAALRHENIATVHQFGMRLETGQYFYAMELIEGETLEGRVRRAGPLDSRTTIGIAQQVTSALAAAEKHGLVHRDLKPANLMLVNVDEPKVIGADQAPVKPSKIRELRKSGIPVIKIIDFGLAKAFHMATDPKSLTHDRFVGTPAFASPEQFEHSALDVRSDIYSLGETLWFALTGKTPFAGRTLSEIHGAQKSNVLPTKQLKAAHVPHHLKSLLESMLAFEPASRPGTHELAARLQRCSPEARSIRRTRVALAAAAIALSVAACWIVWKSEFIRHPVTLTAPEKSIAVLPFENRSEDKANAFFADGVQDEILTDLAKIADLKVISRASVMQYKTGVARNLRKISEELGVAHVVEGSVQRAANKVRVNAQLLDARTDAHLWAQTYDRDLADVFAIQSEIAKAIADQLQAKLSPNEKKAIEQPPTTDLAAFDLYSRAKSLLLTAGFSATADPDRRKAIELLDEAVKRDPSFFDAYCQLAYAHEQLYAISGFDHTPARLALAEAAVLAATRLRPDAAETHLARAQYLYNGLRDYAGALAELEIARRALPNDPRLFALTGYVLRRRGQQEEGLRNLERAVELDPRNFYTLQQIGLSYQTLGRFAEAIAALDRALAIMPDNVETRANRGLWNICWKADTRPLHETIDAVLAQGPGAIASAADIWFFCALAERDPAAAERALVAVDDNPCWVDDTIQLSRSFGEGLLARMTKDETRARTAFEAARAQQEKIVQAQPDYGPALCVLGLIDAALGRKELALDEGRRAIALTPLQKDVSNGSLVLQYFAITAAWAGDKELALQQLEAGLRAPQASLMLSYGALKLLPFWDPLRGDPRFEKIVTSLAPKDGSSPAK
jgi:serine/threonine protein kinase/Tfp pilus assembly protein PilF